MNIQPVNFEFTRKRRLKSECDNPGVMHPNSKLRYSVQDCDLEKDTDNRGYNVNFSGSLPNESGAAAKTLMEKFMSTGVFKWLTKFTPDHNIAASALVSLFLAGILRPGVTISLPGKKDLEDKIYAAGHSLASAVIGFVISFIVTTPIDSGLKYVYNDAKKMSKDDYNNLSKEELAEYISKNNLNADDIAKKMSKDKAERAQIADAINELIKDSDNGKVKSQIMAEYVKQNNGVIMPVRELTPTYKYKIVAEKADQISKLTHELFSTNDIIKRGKLRAQIRDLENWISAIDVSAKNITDWFIAVPRAMLTIALIPPILKYVFHVQKKNAAEAKKQEEINQNQTSNVAVQSSSDVQPVKLSMNKFMGGVK